VITNLALTSDPMHREDRFIAACNSWSEFWERAKKLPSKERKGALYLSASRNSISRSRRNIKQSYSTSGQFATCLPTFADYNTGRRLHSPHAARQILGNSVFHIVRVQQPLGHAKP
jgi:hypothetical protein